jgi:hypothetical protein
LVFGFLFAYFIKCQLGICLIKNFPLDKYPPLSLLQDRNPYHIVYSPRINVDLLPNRIPFLSRVGIWDDFWMREKGMVTIGEGGQRLVIISRSAKEWALGAKKLIQVSPGEVFSFSGWVKTSGKEAVGALSVTLYDADRQVKDWNYAMEPVSGADNWQKVEREFTMPVGVKYIRFRLTGWGEGKAWFDGIKFMEIKGQEIKGHNT